MTKTLVWLRDDLRVQDNPALAWAAKSGSVLPVFIWESGSDLGGASKWWLYHSLQALKNDLPGLVIKKGAPKAVLNDLIKQHQIDFVVWNRRYTPAGIACDIKLKAELPVQSVKTFNSSLLYEPWEIENREGKPFKVFTPFWKACLATKDPTTPLCIGKIEVLAHSIIDDDISELLPQGFDWSKGLKASWTPGEKGALNRLDDFIQNNLTLYSTKRDFLWPNHTSCLSAHLHFGEISPRQVWHRVQEAQAPANDKEKFLSEMGWREFSYHLLYHFPTLPEHSLRPEFENFPWRDDPKALSAWKKGKTGIPIVDAAMRELWTTGFMHNRARMITASFLTKHLLIPWQKGAAWFLDTLVDADLANNSASWQWVAGCGADAAPYFRVFNPVLQGQKFDPSGDYVRKWVPELARVETKCIHHPLNTAIVDLQEGRKRALRAFETIK
ncbi:MAG: deoxyribodipyrimidine photo-lyase [Chlamydiia bacterium]|nr:deoxyribodipyrimidine photo-lyase [Chlamydiia bacterium]